MRLRPPGTARCWPRLPRRTARLRLTALYGGLFLACGAVLLAVTYLLVEVTGNPTGSGSQLPGQRQLTASPAAQPSPAGQCSQQAGQCFQLTGPFSAGQLHQIEAAQKVADTRLVKAVLRELLVRSPVALAIVTVVAIALGWIVAGRILRPLATITAAARRISASNLNERLSLHGPADELRALGDTLDDLFARLEASFESQRHFVANASHELRTPITRERAMLQVALDDPGTTTETWRSTTREVLASNAEQESLIEALLTLASSEGGLGQREPVDLAAIASAVLAAPRPGIGRLGLHIQATAQPADLDGDPFLIERLAANLVGNAVRHNIPGGRVEIATGTKDGYAVLSVASTGPVIPPAEVDRLFQPFQRLHPRRAHNGHGLGLSIVRAIATAHGATITAQAPPGGGLAIDVTFPRRPIPAPPPATSHAPADPVPDRRPAHRHNTPNRPCPPPPPTGSWLARPPTRTCPRRAGGGTHRLSPWRTLAEGAGEGVRVVERADDGQRLRPRQHLRRDSAHVIVRDGLDGRERLVDRLQPRVHQLRLAEPAHP
jgi:signal transduction histidine kinase